MRKRRPPEERFWEKVDRSGDCWLWMAGRISTGYGAFHPTKGTTVLAHRWAYENEVGPIPDGLVIDHLCRVRHCVRPSHLEPVTGQINSERGAGYALLNGMRTACRNGHEYTTENTYIQPSKDNTRRCRECARAHDRKRTPRRRTAA
jgi:hypothetical protein